MRASEAFEGRRPELTGGGLPIDWAVTMPPSNCYWSKIGCSIPKVLVDDGTEVIGTVPRK
jgi:hypothetical protein